MKKLLLIIIISSLSCNSLVEPESEWIILFDGSSLDGWQAIDGSELPYGWNIIDNTLDLTREIGFDENLKSDIKYGSEKFDNFDLYLEWKIPPGGNSGIFYHIQESSEASPEYQIIDDVNYDSIHGISLSPLQKTASYYGMFAADENIKILNPVGQWNTSRIIFTEEQVEYWLNGVKVLSFIPWTDEWYKKKNSGESTNLVDYGEYRDGYIGFQDYGNNISFRNIKIKRINNE
tara:strand:- start:451 stop:1149 length:699 start_codon:yes stop_codon:yes gene_type:complete